MAKALSPIALAKVYLLAKEFVLQQGFDSEIDWQEDVSFAGVTESDFLREAAWVILCSGFRESILRKRFDQISKAFLHWESGRVIAGRSSSCRAHALSIFRSECKIAAILTVAERVATNGFAAIKARIEADGVNFLMELPFIGETTAFHLAKNLGLQVVKPDRHLVRAAKAMGYSSPDHLCRAIGSIIDEKIAVVDLVIWRYATLNPHYEAWFRHAGSCA